MNNIINIDAAADVQLALSEIYLDSTRGAVSVSEQYEALMTYREADDEALAEVPQAFAAYLDHQRKQWG